ncbi:MAG: hypothetical protein AABZ57_08035 [Candidatus Margulisiibacteriota bacterium]
MNYINNILCAEKGVDEWQVEICKKNNDPFEVDELIICISILPETDRQALEEALRSKILCATEIGVNRIDVLSQNEMVSRIEIEQSFKAKRFVDKRK